MRAAPRRLLASYDDFAASLVAEGILSDPWVDGAPRFRMTPLAIDRERRHAEPRRAVDPGIAQDPLGDQAGGEVVVRREQAAGGGAHPMGSRNRRARRRRAVAGRAGRVF